MCFQSLYTMVAGQFSDDAVAPIRDACSRVVASCQVQAPNNVVSNVDLSCLDNLYSSTSGRPTAQTALAWARSCRAVPVDRCTALSGRVEQGCLDKIYTMTSGRLTSAQAIAAARACRTVEATCGDR